MRRLRLLALVAVAVLVPAACGSDTPDGYSEATESIFLETCAAGLGAGELAVCRCAYGVLTDELDFESYTELDREVRDDPEELPAALRAITARCAADTLSPPDPSTTTTTTTAESDADDSDDAEG